MTAARPTFFNRFLLPGFAFKAVVIGGGYATGRELVEFFFPSGAAGGVLGLVATMAIFSLVCTVTFLFARVTDSYDYKTFFKNLLGPGWPVFEIAYVLMIMLVLSIFGAAAGEIGKAVFGWPPIVGTLLLMAGIVSVATFGNTAVEQLFKYVSFFLYAVYALFVILAFTKFGDRIIANLVAAPPGEGWLKGAFTYSGYNLVGATVILPMIRHLTSRKDAVIAGLLCGPLAVLPALLFFLCMIAFYPEVGAEVLPSNFLLEKLDLPVFHIVFQTMIFAALLESGTGLVHAVNERAASAYAERGAAIPMPLRTGLTLGLIFASVVIAAKFGLIELIAKGYGYSAYLFLGIYVVPLLSYGVWRLLKRRGAPLPAPAE